MSGQVILWDSPNQNQNNFDPFWGEYHQALTVKGERHPICGTESNPCSTQDLNSDCSGERQTCYHGATKLLHVHVDINKTSVPAQNLDPSLLCVDL